MERVPNHDGESISILKLKLKKLRRIRLFKFVSICNIIPIIYTNCFMFKVKTCALLLASLAFYYFVVADLLEIEANDDVEETAWYNRGSILDPILRLNYFMDLFLIYIFF